MFYSKGKRYYYYLSTGSAESSENFMLLADKRLYHNFTEIDYLLLHCTSEIQNQLFDIGRITRIMHFRGFRGFHLHCKSAELVENCFSYLSEN